MDFLQDLFEGIVTAAVRVWPAVLGAALLGYFGLQWFGAIGFWAGAAAGSIGGIWAADWLGLRKVKASQAQRPTEIMISSAGGFALVIGVYLLMQFFYLVVIAAVVIGIALVAMAILGSS